MCVFIANNYQKVSRTDLYEYILGQSTVSTVSAYIEYNSPFHRPPKIENIHLSFFGSIDYGSEITTKYLQESGTQRIQLLFTFSSSVGWKDNIHVHWHTYEEWSPICTFHDDNYCTSHMRKGCSESFYDNTCLSCFEGYAEHSQSQLQLSTHDSQFGSNICERIEPDQILLVINDAEIDTVLEEGLESMFTVARVSSRQTSPLGIGSVRILYTIHHWQTDEKDFDSIVSGDLYWKNNDRSSKSIIINPTSDNLFELSELFWLKLMVNATDNNITIVNESLVTEMTIKGPNDLYDYQGYIEILDENLQILENRTIFVDEQNMTLVFYLALRNSSNYCEVYFQTQENTAINGLDFIPVNQSLIWYKNSISKNMVKKISVHILDDDIWEIPIKSFKILLWKSYGVATPIDTLTININDNEVQPDNCTLTNWTEWTSCNVKRGSERIYRSKIAAVADDLFHLHCTNVSEFEWCTNWDKSLFPGISINPFQITLRENTADDVLDDESVLLSNELSIMLQTAPNLTTDLGYDPYPLGEAHTVAEVTLSHPRLVFYPKTVRFTVSSWFSVISVFVTVVDDEIYNAVENSNFYFLFPQIAISSPDPIYFELSEEKKSILGKLTIKVIEDDLQNVTSVVQIGKKSNIFIEFFGNVFHFILYKIPFFVQILLLVVLCVLVIGCHQYRRFNKREKVLAVIEMDEKEKKIKYEELENIENDDKCLEFEDEQILEELIDADV